MSRQDAYLSELHVVVFPKPGVELWADDPVSQTYRLIASDLVKKAEALANDLPPGWKITITRPNTDEEESRG
jgi:hypothetical protein